MTQHWWQWSCRAYISYNVPLSSAAKIVGSLVILSAGQSFVEMASSSAECGAAAAAVNGDSAESPTAATAMSSDENDELAFEVWALKTNQSDILSLPRTATEIDFQNHENSLDNK